MALVALHIEVVGTNLAALLRVIGFCICALGITLFVVVTWGREWRFTEPLAVGVFAVYLAALCFPALHLIGSPKLVSNINDNAVLYAAGPANQRLTLTVRVGSVESSPTESFELNNRGKSRISWALLLTSGARLTGITRTATDIDHRPLTVGSGFVALPPGRAQLLSGSLDGYSSLTFGGRPTGQFAATTAAQTSVSLPTYEGGSSDGSSGPRANPAIIAALGGQPTYGLTRNLPIVVVAGHLPSVDSLLKVDPSTTPPANDQTELQWVSNFGPIKPSYTAIDQGTAATDNDALFLFAVLLGVAGAALVGSLQGIIHILSSRRSS